jgi:3'(2'), 5'-bisphosphate nucleotidase
MTVDSASNPPLEAIVSLAKEAGLAIMALYNEGELDVRLKEDVSPVTRADLAAHRVILAGLQELTPMVPVLSEESESIPYSERQRWETYWLVDPLDGTKEFIKRNGEFTVNIALIVKGEPLLGVVHAPALGRTYSAVLGKGAFRQESSRERPSRIVVHRKGGRKLKVVVSRSHPGAEAEAFLRALGTYDTVQIGSSLKFCLVAEGSADIYPRFGPTREWDTAAGHCVLSSAGGAMTDLHGQPLRYSKPDLLNPPFIATGILELSSYQWHRVAGERLS